MLSLLCCLFGVAFAVPLDNSILQTVPPSIIEKCPNSSGTLERIQVNASCHESACHFKGGQHLNIQIQFQVGKNSSEILSEIDFAFHFNTSMVEGDLLDGKLEMACGSITTNDGKNVTCPLLPETTYILSQSTCIPDFRKAKMDKQNGTMSIEIAADDDGIDSIICAQFPIMVHSD